MELERQINLASYPVTDPASTPARELLDSCRKRLDEQGAYVLEGFLTRGAVAGILTELDAVLGQAYFKPKSHNPYLAPDDASFPNRHPRNRRQLTTSATLAYDFIPEDGLLEAIYRWRPLRAFVARTLGFEELHPYEDALAAVNVLVYPPGTETGWHFDNAHFVVTLMLRPAEQGGAYEYAPFIRPAAGESFGAMGAVLDGCSTQVRTLAQHAGDLVVFQGRDTLHRVTPVAGEAARLVAVLSYDAAPGKSLTAHTQMTFYGRSLKAPADTARG